MFRTVTQHHPWDETAQRQRVTADFASAQIIQVNGQDIGLFKVVYSSKEVHLSQIQLLPEWQSRGIGTKLILQLQQECAASHRPITLQVLHLNPSKALYERLGFKVIHTDSHSHLMIWRYENR